MPKINIWISWVLLSWCSCLKEHCAKCSQSRGSISGMMKRFLFLNTIELHKIKEIYMRLWWIMIVVIANLCVLQNLAWFISSELQRHRFHRFIISKLLGSPISSSIELVRTELIFKKGISKLDSIGTVEWDNILPVFPEI